MGIIYVIANSINGKKYIGQSKNSLADRMKSHKSIAKNNPSQPISYAIRKHGIEAFAFAVIEECDNDILDDREIYWIGVENTTLPNGYNKTTGGKGRPFPLDDTTKFKMSASRTGRRHTEESKAKMSKSRKGWNPSESTRAKMRNHALAMMDKLQSDDVKAKRTSAMVDTKSREEWKRLVSGANHPKSKKVRCVETGEVFQSIELAGKSIGRVGGQSVKRVLDGMRKTTGGFHWEYVNADN
jgi:group I intron endonuclease